jgi:hypothetical protein
MSDILSTLPNELIELILSNLPLSDLLASKSLVCKRWKDIVGNENFLPYRKLYFR